MWFARKRDSQRNKKEAEIQAVRQETLRSIDKAIYATSKVNDLLEDDKLGTTELIFLATGGEYRSKRK